MYEQRLFVSKNISKFNDQFYVICTVNKFLDIRKNFKLSLSNINNNDTTMKTKPFQEQQQQKMKISAHD